MTSRYLVVDLDGSLISTDLLRECVVQIVFTKPWLLLALPFWLYQGKAGFKARVFTHCTLDLQVLPYRTAVLDLINRAKSEGQSIVLATASYHELAQGVAEQVKCFDHIIASDQKSNVKGKTKLDRVLHLCHGAAFNYVGDARADRALWAASDTAYVVNSPREAAKLASDNNAVTRIDDDSVWWKDVLIALRLKQWVKNGLILVPAILSGTLFTPAHWLPLLGAILIFGMVASGMYVANDLMDLQDDRRHRSKRYRPFASGRLDLMWGVVLAPALILSGLSSAYLLMNNAFFWTVVTYLALNVAYNIYFKKVMMADVVVLASLFTIRVYAGGAALTLEVSQWLLAFSVFVFLSLALAKRVTELLYKQVAKEALPNRRDYLLADIGSLSYLGSASGFVSALVLALYISSPSVAVHYNWPEPLWIVCLILLFWISRIWILVSRGVMVDDPTEFGLQDHTTWLCGITVFTLIALGMYGIPGGLGA